MTIVGPHIRPISWNSEVSNIDQTPLNFTIKMLDPSSFSSFLDKIDEIEKHDEGRSCVPGCLNGRPRDRFFD